MRTLAILFIALAPLFAAAQTESDSLAVAAEVDSLLTAANELRKAGRNKEALPLAERAADISKTKWGERNALHATALHRLASIYSNLGRYDEGKGTYHKTIELRAKILGKEHPDYAASLNGLGGIFWREGDYSNAEPLFLEANQVQAKALRREDPAYAATTQNLGLLYWKKGELAKAERLMLEAKQIRAKTLGEAHPDFGKSLFNLGSLYRQMGDYEKTERLYLKSMEIWAVAPGKEHTDYATALSSLSNLYMANGNYAAAAPLIKESIETQARVVGKGHESYAESLAAQAVLFWHKGQYAEAEPLFLEAVSIQARALGEQSLGYAEALGSLGVLYQDMGEYAKALQRFLEERTIMEATIGTENPGYAAVLNNTAIVHDQMGEYAKAEPLFLKAHEIWAKTLGLEHPNCGAVVDNLAMMCEESNRLQKAAAYYIESNRLIQSLSENTAAYSSENQMLAYLKTLDDKNERFKSFSQAHPTPQLARAAYDNALFFNGLLLENARRLARSIAGADSLTRDTYARWQGCHRRLAAEYAKPIAERQFTAEVEAEAEAFEKTLARSLPSFGETRKTPHWESVRDNLLPGEAAVEFVRYRYFAPKETDSVMYAALVLRPGDDRPRPVFLFENKQIFPFLRKSNSSDQDLIDIAYNFQPGKTSLYSLVWQPLQPFLEGATTVFCAPTGVLHRLNLGATASGPGETFADRHRLVTLGSTRQLLNAAFRTQNAGSGAAPSKSAILFGGVKYDLDSTTVAPVFQNDMRGDGGATASFELPFLADTLRADGKSGWKELPSTKTEVEDIAKLLDGQGFKLQSFGGAAASEENFKNIGQSGPSPMILHLATHGYFFPEPKDPNDVRGRVSPPSGGLGGAFKVSEKPMIRSGLILAGANRAWLGARPIPGHDDGILTAYEISQMNLQGTELVVLSACETGLGDIEGNEGVYGLQRAFKIAGAHYLVMSLWSVSDRKTAELMTAFYQNLLEKGQPVPDAFRAAQNAMRAKYPTTPSAWAGFVLVE